MAAEVRVQDEGVTAQSSTEDAPQSADSIMRTFGAEINAVWFKGSKERGPGAVLVDVPKYCPNGPDEWSIDGGWLVLRYITASELRDNWNGELKLPLEDGGIVVIAELFGHTTQIMLGPTPPKNISQQCSALEKAGRFGGDGSLAVWIKLPEKKWRNLAL